MFMSWVKPMPSACYGVLLKSMGILVLRFTRPEPRAFRVPLNLKFKGIELPVGLSIITLMLLAIATTNLFTKPVATLSGVTFAAFLFLIFTLSERVTRQHNTQARHVDKFQLIHRSALSPEMVGCRPGGLLVCVSNYHVLWPLADVLRQANVEQRMSS